MNRGGIIIGQRNVAGEEDDKMVDRARVLELEDEPVRRQMSEVSLYWS